ncbi:hypothetical protein FQN49_005080, partial [Arthroderma sp. PD_2]
TPVTAASKPFQLQAPPSRSSSSIHNSPRGEIQQPPLSPGMMERVNQPVAPAPGEQSYGAVPIPGAYRSPSFGPQMTLPNTPGIGVAVSENAAHNRNNSR